MREILSPMSGWVHMLASMTSQTDGSALSLQSPGGPCTEKGVVVEVAVVVVMVIVVGSAMRMPQELHMIGQERDTASPRTRSVHVLSPMMAQAARSTQGLHVPHVAGHDC